MKARIRLKRKPTVYPIIFVVVISIIILLGILVRPWFLSATTNFQQFLWEKGRNISYFFSGLFPGIDLKKENDALQRQNQNLLFRLTWLKRIEKENKELREVLGLELHKSFAIIDALVTAKDIEEDSLFINKGQRDGVEQGLIVITPQKSLLGTIEKVYDNNSLMFLVSDPQTKINVQIGESNVESIAKGNGKLRLVVENLPKEKLIELGDLVTTSKLQKDLPQGLLVGKVKKIKKSDVSPFQRLEIEPFFNFSELNLVFVITNS